MRSARIHEYRKNQWGVLTALRTAAIGFFGALIVFNFGCSEDSKELARTLSAPDDYWKSLAEVDASFDGSINDYTLSWLNPFTGLYAIDVMVEDPPPASRAYDTPLKIHLDCSDEDENKRSQPGNTTDWPFTAGAEHSGGFHLMFFTVPEELPLNQRVDCAVRIDVGDPKFHERYGQAKLVVRKLPDK